MFKQKSLTFSSPHFWVLAVMLIIGIIFHYPQQIFNIESASLFSFLGLSRHAVERILFLIPIVYAGLMFGFKAGLTGLAITLAIIIPRVFLYSEYRADAVLESSAVFALGLLANIWLEVKRRENKIFEQLMTRLKESEKDMSISEQKYQYLFENASDAIWVQDVNGRFVDGNRAWQKLTGFTVEEIKGIHLGKFLPGEALELAREVRKKLVSGRDFEQPYEQQVYVKGGSEKTIKMSTNALISDGKITGFEHIARDVTQEKRHQENVQAYIQQITRAQEEERKRIARDLHDDVSPDIIVLIQKLDKITSAPRPKISTVRHNLEEVRDQAVKALEGLRATAQGLRPRIIDDLGLVAALEWIAEELERDQKIRIEVETKGIDRKMSSETQILLFRIAQEALNNIRKHARASNAIIRLEGGESDITMTVIDDGQGFKAPDKIEGMVSAGRLGLMGMHERARLLNGKLQIKSAPGKGTEIRVTLPWPVEDQD